MTILETHFLVKKIWSTISEPLFSETFFQTPAVFPEADTVKKLEITVERCFCGKTFKNLLFFFSSFFFPLFFLTLQKGKNVFWFKKKATKTLKFSDFVF
jgi:hypothetical protein